LPPAIPDVMEEAFSSDYGGVRVHTDLTAQLISEGLGREAFTIGNRVAVTFRFTKEGVWGCAM
jgi:hypothetical protein